MTEADRVYIVEHWLCRGPKLFEFEVKERKSSGMVRIGAPSRGSRYRRVLPPGDFAETPLEAWEAYLDSVVEQEAVARREVRRYERRVRMARREVARLSGRGRRSRTWRLGRGWWS